MNKYIWIGLDVHVDSITAAILEGDQKRPDVVKMSGDLMKVRRLFSGAWPREAPFGLVMKPAAPVLSSIGS